MRRLQREEHDEGTWMQQRLLSWVRGQLPNEANCGPSSRVEKSLKATRSLRLTPSIGFNSEMSSASTRVERSSQ